MKKNNKEITISDLAFLMQKGFKESDDKINSLSVRMEKGFKESDDKINSLSVRMEKGFKDSDEKFNSLSVRMEKGFKESDKRTDQKIESLAMMVQKGFESMDKKFEKKFDLVHDELKEINGRLTALEKGQDDLKLHQGNMPYRFELKEQEEKLGEHDKRIRLLERKVLLVG